MNTVIEIDLIDYFHSRTSNRRVVLKRNGSKFDLYIIFKIIKANIVKLFTHNKYLKINIETKTNY